ncbi:unnamed protein product [Miscanthus lutarioriparius]|uniref:Uncharacterized protein n=1 Tax=Miscanthus lutarioriparius TaxID=422564 RepID=A0A811P8V8_9POAL|nr:unnamed protein product [Miscanthus lutarioriparius]
MRYLEEMRSREPPMRKWTGASIFSLAKASSAGTDPYAGDLRFNTIWARSVAEAKPWYNKSGANETDPVQAVIAKRMAAVGSTYGFARSWL